MTKQLKLFELLILNTDFLLTIGSIQSTTLCINIYITLLQGSVSHNFELSRSYIFYNMELRNKHLENTFKNIPTHSWHLTIVWLHLFLT